VSDCPAGTVFAPCPLFFCNTGPLAFVWLTGHDSEARGFTAKWSPGSSLLPDSLLPDSACHNRFGPPCAHRGRSHPSVVAPGKQSPHPAGNPALRSAGTSRRSVDEC